MPRLTRTLRQLQTWKREGQEWQARRCKNRPGISDILKPDETGSTWHHRRIDQNKGGGARVRCLSNQTLRINSQQCIKAMQAYFALIDKYNREQQGHVPPNNMVYSQVAWGFTCSSHKPCEQICSSRHAGFSTDNNTQLQKYHLPWQQDWHNSVLINISCFLTAGSNLTLPALSVDNSLKPHRFILKK